MAFAYAFDPTEPANTDLVKDGAAEIRLVKDALIERIQSFFQNIENDPWQVKSGVTFLGSFTQNAGTAALQAVTATTGTFTGLIIANADIQFDNGEGIKNAAGQRYLYYIAGGNTIRFAPNGSDAMILSPTDLVFSAIAIAGATSITATGTITSSTRFLLTTSVSGADGSMYFNSTNGLSLRGKAGITYDIALVAPDTGICLGVPTGTHTVRFGADIAVTGAATAQTGTVVSIGNSTQTTVGAAGAADALPATPTGYLKAYIGLTQIVFPYYAQA